MITTAQWNDLVKNARVQWAKTRLEQPEVRQKLAKIVPVSELTSEHSSISRAETARRRSENGNAYTGSHKQGFTVNFNQEEVAIIHEVSKLMRLGDKYQKINEMVRGGKVGVLRRLEMDVAAHLTYAWATSYTNMDGETVSTATPGGLSLINSTHVPNSNPNSVSFANQLSSTHDPISPEVWEDLEELFNNFLDETDGRSTPVTPNAVIFAKHAPTKSMIERITGSTGRQGTANNDKNTFKDVMKIEVPFLATNHATEGIDSTKKRYVFLANISDLYEGIRVEMIQDPQLEAPDKVYETSAMQMLSTAVYDHALMRANWIAGTKGDGSAVS